MEPGIQTIVEQATYYINAEFADESELSGTGFCINSPGLIMTCAHVVSRIRDNVIEVASSIDVDITANGRTTSYSATIVKNGNPVGPLLPANMGNPNNLDLALIALTGQHNVPQLNFLQTNPDRGSECDAFGAFYEDDDDIRYVCAPGVVDAVFQNENNVTCLIRHECAIDEGFSGGPLTDDEGNVIGVNVLADPSSNRRYAIAAEIAWAFIPD